MSRRLRVCADVSSASESNRAYKHGQVAMASLADVAFCIGATEASTAKVSRLRVIVLEILLTTSR